jgi:hypothetical protein
MKLVMNADIPPQILKLLKSLPYRKWWFWVIVLLVGRGMFMAYNNSRSVVYDAQALGFSNESAMNASFAKGYHTRQKMDEMERSRDAPSSAR